MAKKTKLPKDTNKRAKSIVDLATNDQPEKVSPKRSKKATEKETLQSAAAQLGRKGGLKGGPARAKALNSKRRSEIAKRAAEARWGNQKADKGD